MARPRQRNKGKRGRSRRGGKGSRPNCKCCDCGQASYHPRKELSKAAGIRCHCGGRIQLSHFVDIPPKPSKRQTPQVDPATVLMVVGNDEERLAEFLALVDCRPEDVRDVGVPAPHIPTFDADRFGARPMPWGKYRGRMIRDVPEQYLRWLAGTVDDGKKGIVQFKTYLRQWMEHVDAQPTVAVQMVPVDDDPLSQEFRAIVGPPTQRSA
jgi:hypothetical protein